MARAVHVEDRVNPVKGPYTICRFLSLIPEFFWSLLLPLRPAVSGCAVHPPHRDTTASIDRSYFDLEPGWRIRVVMPILKSGAFKVQTERLETNGSAVALKTTDDFVGLRSTTF